MLEVLPRRHSSHLEDNRYERLIVSDGSNECGLDRATAGAIEEPEGYVRLGSGLHYDLLAKPGEETVYRRFLDVPEPLRPFPSFFHWALSDIEFAEMVDGVRRSGP